MCGSLTYLLDKIIIRFFTRLYRQFVGIPVGTNSAPLIADLYLFYYERDSMSLFLVIKKLKYSSI